MNPLYSLILFLIVLWAMGFGFHVGGDLIHVLLVIALIVFIVDRVGTRV